MDEYELILILPQDLSSTKKKTFLEKLEKTVKGLKGKVREVADWGKIDLEYSIKQQKTGNFMHFILELDRQSIKSLNERLRIESGIIRYLLVKNPKSK